MANKRVIDLAELSQTVQEGQYILVDSAGGTGKMDLKQIVDDNAIDPEGAYPDLYAGDLVTEKHQTDSVPYLFRPSASVGNRAYETIVGASVGWNQLVQSGATSVTVQSGHKYYAKIDGTESIGASAGSAITINDSSKDMVTDLTALLGSTIADYIYSLEQATAGSGISKLREWGFCTGYPAYNAGSIESVEVTEKVVRGFNQWDEEWEVGGLNPTTGDEVVNSAQFRSKNYIPVLYGKNYFMCNNNDYTIGMRYYDADKNYIGSFAIVGINRELVFGTASLPTNTAYIKFVVTTANAYNNDICINLSSDRNGEYEPYKSESYPLGNDILRGIFKLDANNNLYADGDVKEADGVITRRYGVVDLGTLDYTYDNTVPRFYTTGVTDIKAVASNGDVANVVCPVYSATALNALYNNPTNGTMAVSTGKALTIINTAYNSSADFKTAMSGVYLVYELQTPTTETSTPFTSPQIVYPDGTEQFITENGVPVGHSTDYPYSIKALAEELIDIPDVPSASGTYVLKATRSASGITYAWVTG